jgi:hypothetical protein
VAENFVRTKSIYPLSIEENLAARALQETSDQVKESGFPGTIGADESSDGPRPHLKGTVVDRSNAAKVFDHILYL